jgi:heme ABC exporter ATP-binding subunit CcmA
VDPVDRGVERDASGSRWARGRRYRLGPADDRAGSVARRHGTARRPRCARGRPDGVVEPVIELVDVVAVLGSFPALAGASLVVRRGEIVLLRGPNGAGKSTLLRVCAGLVPITRGEGRVVDCDLRTQRDAVRRRVGLLGHANGLYLELTVRENVHFWGATVGASRDEIDAALDLLGLVNRLTDMPVSRLSAGQKRRTALACLVARRAQVWLLDEPHAGLDAAGRDDLDATLRAAVQAGATVVVASHELDRAGSLATRVVDVVGGQVHEVGT